MQSWDVYEDDRKQGSLSILKQECEIEARMRSPRNFAPCLLLMLERSSEPAQNAIHPVELIDLWAVNGLTQKSFIMKHIENHVVKAS
jgi:hypothetical protein